ncbi:transaldolase [Salinibacillus kushneri]|uniref:Transaldolase n=1 Tax=Salinibacillus kushneri TaxID=237682 RepID=A0A1H9Z257_9BACI|nr:transaldolase family protein [Salinibacillus kushneri]SES75439.1 transaldolase [Salinibacillus kushneri]
MELYLDSANTEEIQKVSRLQFLDGITTNPSIIAKQSESFETKIKQIGRLIDGKVWCQVTGENAEEMYHQAIEMSGWTKDTVIKIPMNFEGLVAAGELVKKNIEVNFTLVYSLSQVILAAKANVAYISPYVGRTDNYSLDGKRFIKEAKSVFQNLNSSTKIIGASIKSPQTVVDLVHAGADAVTMSYDVLNKMFQSPLTDMGLDQFNEDWQNYIQNK